MATADELAQMILNGLRGGKLVNVQANQGPIPSFTLAFENDEEESGTLTFQPSLLVTAGPGIAEVRAQITVNVGEFKK